MAKNEQKTEQRSGRILGRRYRYTDDYKVLPALGGSRERRVLYTAPWTALKLDEEAWKTLVLRLRILTAAAVLAFIAAFLLPIDWQSKWYMPALALACFPLAYQVMAAAVLPSAKKPLERQQYDKSFVRLSHSAVFALVLICLSALGCAVFWILAAAGVLETLTFSPRDAAFAALLILMAAVELLTHRLCRGIETETLENSAYSG